MVIGWIRLEGKRSGSDASQADRRWRPVPVEIPDAEHELVIERVAAIDVAKAAGKVCVRLPARSGRRFSRVWDLPARTGAIAELAEHLVGLGVEKSPSSPPRITGESGTTCWRRRGFECSWSTPAMSRTCRADPRPTSSTQCGWQADREGPAAAVVRAAGADPAAA